MIGTMMGSRRHPPHHHSRWRGPSPNLRDLVMSTWLVLIATYKLLICGQAASRLSLSLSLSLSLVLQVAGLAPVSPPQARARSRRYGTLETGGSGKSFLYRHDVSQEDASPRARAPSKKFLVGPPGMPMKPFHHDPAQSPPTPQSKSKQLRSCRF